MTFPGSVELEVRGEQLILLPERAVFWPAARMLLVADVHCGKAAALRRGSVPVPEGNMQEDLGRLSQLMEATSAQSLAILGDWIHAAAGLTPHVMRSILHWQESLRDRRLIWVKGNHDRVPPQLRAMLGAEEHDNLVAPPFYFQHLPFRHNQLFTFCGHVHPGIVLGRYRGFPRMRLPCFHFTLETAILPAFGSFTGATEIHPEPEERVFVIAEDRVVEWRNISGSSAI